MIAVAASVPYSPPLSAQEEASSALEEVIVTASRREEALQDVAIAVSVIDVGEFTDAGLTSLTDILPFVPGVSVGDSGAPFSNSVYVRGINAFLSAGVVSYIDEIPFGSSTVYTNPTPLDGTLLDLGTLDVMKGPQGTLYGSSAMGGILKFNTRDASLTDWTGSLSADLSATEGGGLNQLYRVNANGPIAEDSLGLSFTAFWKDKAGYIDNVTIPKNDWDDYEYYGGSGSLRWLATEKLEITVQGLYQKSTQDGLATIQANHAQDALLPGKGPAEPWFGEYATGETDINPSEYEAEVLGLTVDYDLGFAKLTSVTSLQEMSFVQTLDVTVPFAFYADIFFPESAPHTAAALVGDLGFEKLTQELRLTSESNEKFEWIVGGFYSDEEGHNIQELVITPTAPLYFANFPSNYDELSLFANGTWYFTPDFDGSVGVRYADYSNDVELSTVGPLIAPLPLTEIDDSVTNYLFNLRYRVGDTMSIYGRAASGYRPGGANFSIIDPGTGEPLANPFFEPDSLWSYEAGVKGSTADGRVTYDVAVFYIDWEDYIISVNRGGLNVAGNAEEASSKGAEASLAFAATEALTVTAVASWGRAELEADEPDLGGADGDRLPGSPEWSGALDFDYRFNLGDLPSYAGLAYRYKGGMPVGFPGYTDSTGNYFPPSAPRVDLDSYNLVDLRAGTQFGPVDVSLYITNLFDEWAYANFSSSFVSPSLGTPTRPRTFGAVVRWNFF
ncbi:MAG: TonB-dependent receptor [Xanthomonadales bacterium]|nr:TonB-dependent receptor [Xanthomonadales bacterium]